MYFNIITNNICYWWLLYIYLFSGNATTKWKSSESAALRRYVQDPTLPVWKQCFNCEAQVTIFWNNGIKSRPFFLKLDARKFREQYCYCLWSDQRWERQQLWLWPWRPPFRNGTSIGTKRTPLENRPNIYSLTGDKKENLTKLQASFYVWTSKTEILREINCDLRIRKSKRVLP